MQSGQDGILFFGANGAVSDNIVSLNRATGININAGTSLSRHTSTRNAGNGTPTCP